MRPTIDHLLDCQIQIWRPMVTNDAVGVEERPLAVVAVVAAFINRPRTPDVQVGGGLAPSGTVTWYGRVDIDVLLRDVCEVVSGPDIGRTFEVNEPPVRPKNHHTEVVCIEWHGTLPDVAS